MLITLNNNTKVKINIKSKLKMMKIIKQKNTLKQIIF